MAARYVSGPATAPIALADLRAQVRAPSANTIEDTLLTDKLAAARSHLERTLNIAIGAQAYELVLDCWPSASIELLPAPLQSVESITYYDTDNAEQTLSTDVYGVATHIRPGFVYLKQDQSWPDIYARPDAIKVAFTAGYEAATDWPLPAAIRQWLLHLVTWQFENRGDKDRPERLTDPWEQASKSLANLKVYKF